MSEYVSFDLVEWQAPLEKRKHSLPQPTGKEVLVQVTAAGLCHSDLHAHKGTMDLGQEGTLSFADRGAQLPVTLGHEVAGIVEAVGPDVSSVKVGQQVLVFPWIGCGKCQACAEERESDCTAMRIIGLVQKGGFASHCLVEDEKWLVDIDGLNPTDVVPHACSGVTVLNALEKMGPLREGEWMAVMGCGGVGMNAIAIAQAMGISNIIALDIDDAKLEAAREMGAAAVLNSGHPQAVEELQRLAEGRLMGVIDTFGGPATSRIAVRALLKAGRYIVVGQAGGDFQMPAVWLTQKAMTVRGSHVGNASQLRTLIEMVRAGKVKQMPIELRDLSEINQAMHDLEAGHVMGRIVFQPNESEG